MGNQSRRTFWSIFTASSLFLLASFCTVTLSAQPANDECSGAIAITDGITPFDNLTATDSGVTTDPLQCQGSFLGTATKDIWFSYTAPENGFLDVTTCPAGFDTDLLIYSGDCNEIGRAHV